MKLEDLSPLAIAFVIVGISLGIGAAITAQVSATQTAGTVARAAVDNATSGIGQLASWLPIIGLIVAAAVIIGILFSSFYGAGRSN